MTPKQQNLMELVTEMIQDDENGDPLVSEDFKELVLRGIHHTHLPDTLQPKAAEMLQLAAEAIGGLPRLIQFADRHPAAFYKLYARMVAQTITPVLPPPTETTKEDWPEWLTHRRLAYQEAGFQLPNHKEEDVDG